MIGHSWTSPLHWSTIPYCHTATTTLTPQERHWIISQWVTDVTVWCGIAKCKPVTSYLLSSPLPPLSLLPPPFYSFLTFLLSLPSTLPSFPPLPSSALCSSSLLSPFFFCPSLHTRVQSTSWSPYLALYCFSEWLFIPCWEEGGGRGGEEQPSTDAVQG